MNSPRLPRLGLTLGALVLTLMGCSTNIQEDWTFGWPKGVTEQGERMRHLWTWSSVAALTVGIITWGLIFWACFRYRKKSDDLPRQTKYNLPLEIGYTIAPFLVIAGLFYYTVVVENHVLKTTANPTNVVKVTGFKWNWQFEYVSRNGQKLTYADGKTPLSTVGSSTEIAVMVLPKSTGEEANERVQIIEHADDVIHSWWVPEFLFKMDVIPYDVHVSDASSDDPKQHNQDNRFELNAIETGSFVGRCAELCGAYHSQMNFEVRIVEPDVYQKYLDALKEIGPDDPARQSKALAIAMPNQCPYAVTTHPFNTEREAREATPGQTFDASANAACKSVTGGAVRGLK